MELPNDQENKSYVVLPLSSCGLFGHIMKSTPCRKISFVARALLTGTFSHEMTGLKDRRGPSSAQLCNTIILCIISFEFFTDECKVFLDSYLA